MRWFQALLPREDSFFDRFTAHARLLLKGAEALRPMVTFDIQRSLPSIPPGDWYS